MKINLTLAGLLLGACLLPVAGYTADTYPRPAEPSGAPANANETPGATAPRTSDIRSSRRSDHPIDDSVITTKVKAKFVGDSQIRKDNIEIKTVNGTVELFGTASSRANAARAVTLARQVSGVQSVKNDIQITPPAPVAAGDPTYKQDRTADRRQDRTADRRRSDHPVDDTWITTKVEAKFVKDKQVRARNIQVKTVNGVVELTGTARSRSEASRAATLARQVKGVQSVKNDIEVTSSVAARDGTNERDRTADTRSSGTADRDRTADRRRSDQPVDDSWITTKVKAKLVEDKQVAARNIHVKTVNGVVELTGTARSAEESSQAASLAREVEHVRSVTNNIKVN